ncbi:MAG: hypothetical protein HYS78_01570 [Parcubacteria group bacterium]|nr:hypothetical protein [Parcubacteria group bacterium]
MPDVNEVIGQIYLAGGVLGVLIFISLLLRDGITSTALYWLNPPSFMGPAEHYGSLVALREIMKNPKPVSVIGTIFGLTAGFVSSVIVGILFGGFLLILIYMITREVVNLLL